MTAGIAEERIPGGYPDEPQDNTEGPGSPDQYVQRGIGDAEDYAQPPTTEAADGSPPQSVAEAAAQPEPQPEREPDVWRGYNVVAVDGMLGVLQRRGRGGPLTPDAGMPNIMPVRPGVAPPSRRLGLGRRALGR
jgi:hypothetical protein